MSVAQRERQCRGGYAQHAVLKQRAGAWRQRVRDVCALLLEYTLYAHIE